MVIRLVENVGGRIWDEAIVKQSKFSLGFCLKGLTEVTKTSVIVAAVPFE
jgi:hypothetical protein